MATFIKTPDVSILADAGASLGPRFGLAPHPIEYRALRDARKALERFAVKADVVTISHYHFDHYTATWKSVEAKWTWSSYEVAKRIYGGKPILAKDYRDTINPSQRRRGWIFSQIAKDFAQEIRYVDSASFKYGDTTLSFSQPFPHGEDGTSLGYVLALHVKCHEDHVLFCPDVQGPISRQVLSYIVQSDPSMLIIGGPPIYLSDYKVPASHIEGAFEHLSAIVSKIPLVIIDHHMMRDEKAFVWLSRLKEKVSEDKHKVLTFAEYLAKENLLLEANRPRLYEEEPPSD